MVGDEFLTLPDVRDPPLPGDPVNGEGMRVGLVREDVEDAGRCGGRASVEHLLDPLAKLFLREELLERALPGHDPVAQEIDGVDGIPVEARGDD